jgi:AcrR family transcriptional regulator
MAQTTVAEGYAAATIARVISHAGVSRPTFYNYFADREDCFLATHGELAAGLLDRVGTAVAAQDPARALSATLSVIVEFASVDPVAARVLFHEATAAGTKALDERDKTIARLARIVERQGKRASPAASSPDVYAPALIGSLYRLLSVRLRRGERDLGNLARELQRWLASYDRPTREHRRDKLSRLASLPGSPSASGTSLFAPPPLPSGRAAISPEEVAYNHRERILFACLEVSAQKGYTASTVADITAIAGVDKRVFYEHFRDKQDAFHATLDHAFQPTMAASAAAFFSAPTWPERVWEAGRALTELLAANPTIAHFAIIDAYTIGPTAIQRFEDLRSAYTIFLEEGRQRSSQDMPPPTNTALEAIAAIVFELTYNQIRRGRTGQLSRLLPHVTYLCLAPFLGTDAAEEFIDLKLQGR